MKIDNAKKLIKVIIIIIIAIILLILVVQVIKYNYPNKIEAKESGIFIDRSSKERGVSVEKCKLDAIDNLVPEDRSGYWFSCLMDNYSAPVLLKIYLPFEFGISSFGSCEYPADTKLKVGEKKCHNFPAKVEDNVLWISYNESELPTIQIQISAKLFKKETSDRYVFKSFQINGNPLPFMDDGRFWYENDNIDYSLKIKRDKFLVDISKSNFLPAIENEITGDFNYARLRWLSQNTPGEGILYIEDNEKARYKSMLNILGLTLLGIILGIIFDKIIIKLKIL